MNIDWFAGFFDGEGCVTMTIGSKKFNGYRHWYPKVICAIVNTNSELLERIQNFLKLGKVYPLPDTKPHHRKRFTLTISTVSEVNSFIPLIENRLEDEQKRKILDIAKEATNFLISRRGGKKRAKWTIADLKKFREYELEVKKIIGNKTRGRKRKYALPFAVN